MQYGLRYRANIADPYVVAELEGLLAAIQETLAASLNGDGTVNAANVDTTTLPLQWGAGPLTIDDAGHESSNLATGTYNNLVVSDETVVLEIEPSGGTVNLTGILNNFPDARRLLLLRNRDSTESVVLKDENTGSTEQYRFSCPGNADHSIGPDRSYWLYYDRSRKRWTVVI